MKFTQKFALIPYDKYERLLMKQAPTAEQLTRKPSKSENTTDDVQRQTSPSEMDENELLEHFPKTPLLQLIKQNSVLNWNERAELTVRGNRVDQSHIGDLVKDAMVKQSQNEPVGVTQFYGNFNNLPGSLLRNHNRRRLLQIGRGEQIQPPPGRPEMKRKARVLEEGASTKKSKSDLWKTLWQPLK